MRRVSGFVLAAVLVVGLTACSGGDGDGSARQERRSAALVEAGEQSGAELQLTISQITPPGEAIEVRSYSWGVNKNPQGSPQFGPLNITKTIDQTSPLLFSHLTRGTLLQTAALKLYRDFNGLVMHYASYEMEGVLITSFQSGGAMQGQSLPLEEVSLQYQKIREVTMVPDAQGRPPPPEQFGWDIVRQREW